ncbi:MAG: CDP-6-deoxy-delta-3,4-glucoseen reductase [Rugosibacter sp.]|nr:CDP-6-deoxy-delta-3,4-glucoseen reductase [Rugosibacter sp.]
MASIQPAAPPLLRITLTPSAHSFLTPGEDSLLQAALDAGYVLPYGCRNGACGSCKGKVLEGLVDHGDSQPGALSLADRAAGYALFCCARPLTDVVLECREVSGAKDIPVKTLPCRVEKIERVAEDVIVLSLKLPVNERLQFLAGQYIEFLLKDGKTRAFSIANAPHAEGLLELHIRQVVGGEFTSHIFNHMKVKEILRLRGPLGTFFLREPSDKPIIFVAGGTGFAPIKSIIEQALHSGVKRPMTLYWGARHRAGLYLHELAQRWASEHAHIRYVPVLSEPAASDQWTGRTGLVHQAVLEDQPTLGAFQVYACGAPAMVEAAQRDFMAHGLPAEEFFADAFTFANAKN